MCSIIGWNYNPGVAVIHFMLSNAKQRGRDGWGFEVDGEEYRGLGDIPPDVLEKIERGQRVVGNFRATPTTEEESREDNLQPYGGIVHNGTIANDHDFQDGGIDSMVLPKIINKGADIQEIHQSLKKLKGSYAVAFFHDDGSLITSTNYKPIYLSYAGTESGAGVIFASQDYMIPFITKPHPVYCTGRHVLGSKYFTDYKPKNNRAVISCSGGLDSTTVAYMLKDEGYEVQLVYFTYGCLAEERELSRVKEIAEHGGFHLETITMPKVLSGTIVEGEYHKRGDGESGAEYAYDWVSARNLLMLSILTAYAETNNISYIAFGGNLEEAGAYPDNEEEFGKRFNAILPFATQNGVRIKLLQPLATRMKHEIVAEGRKAGVPFDLTWSCYGGGEVHCGECGPCFMRKKAFERNGLTDPVMEV